MPGPAPQEAYFATLIEESRWIEELVGRLAPPRQLQVLEAGCGREWSLNLGDAEYVLTGVDQNPDALRARADEVKDLDVAVLGDLADVELDDSNFDVIYCAYVLEHVQRATKILENFDRWCASSGLIVLRIPDRDSVLGWLARHTPHAMHVWYYRKLLHRPLAGFDGRAPFPTIYDPAISRDALVTFFCRRGYSLVGDARCRPFPGQEGPFWSAARLCVGLIGALSRGRLSGKHNNLAIVVQKSRTDS